MEVKTFLSYLLSENSFAGITDDGIFLVDPGEYTGELKEFVAAHREEIRLILLTHRHFDHVLGVADLLRDCPHAKTVIHRLDAAGLSDPAFSLASLYKLLQDPVTPDRLCDDGDVIEMGNTSIRVMHTPGHTTGSVCYLTNDAIFCGDTLFYACIGRTDLESGDVNDMAASLRRLNDLPGDYQLYPGHGNLTTLSAERRHNRYLKRLINGDIQ